MKKLVFLIALLPNLVWAAPYGSSVSICAAVVTPDTSAYAAGDIVGGKLTFSNPFRDTYSGLVQGIRVANTEIDSIAWTLCLFDANPTGSTLADQGAPTIPIADLDNVRCYSVSAATSFAASQIFQADGLASSINGSGSNVLYGILITSGAPTWAAGQSVKVCLDIVQN
jgi:hypothetical protein